MIICLLKDTITITKSDLEPVSFKPIDKVVIGSKY